MGQARDRNLPIPHYRYDLECLPCAFAQNRAANECATGLGINKSMIYSDFEGIFVSWFFGCREQQDSLRRAGEGLQGQDYGRILRFMTVHGWRWEEEPESDARHQTGQILRAAYLNLIASPLQVTLSEQS